MRNIVYVLLLISIFKTPARSQVLSDSIIARVAPEYDKVGKFHRFWLGEGYRKLWAAPVKMKVFHLKKEKGGLTILQRGGGLQTKSLRLKDASGKEWVLRTLQKYPERGLPENLRKTVARDILQDQVVTGHPYSALVVPPFATALSIPHSNPQVVYIPDDPAFGEYRSDFANSVMLFEERESIDTLNTDNTEKAQRRVEDDNDVRFDQRLVLRARLLDLLLGDWDRHEDQWRWQRKKELNKTWYTPVPRDRDKVFYHTTGVLPFLLSRQWLKSNLQGYRGDIRDVKGYNYNNRYFDRYFLNQLSEDDWRSEIAYVQRTITDSLINRAMHLLPDTVYALSAPAIVKRLKERRPNLEKEGMKYYRFLSKNIDIPASDKHELFEISTGTDRSTSLNIWKIKKDGARENIIYKGTFDPSITKEIRLYGLKGNDVFTVSGNKRSPIKVRMIGGEERDSFYVNTELRNKNNLLIYDRLNNNNALPANNLARLKVREDTAVNAFNRKSFKYNRFSPAPSLFYNADQGLLIRLAFLAEKHGFRKEPYSFRQLIAGNYSTAQRSYMFNYSGDFKKLIGKNDLTINIVSRGPRYLTNFFGIGNETTYKNPGKGSIEFYRNGYDHAEADIRLGRSFGEAFRINVGPRAEFYTSSPTSNVGRFLSVYNVTNPAEEVFTDRWLAGGVMSAELDTRNDDWFPNKGIFWNTSFTAMKRLNGDKKGYGRIYSDLSFFVGLKDSTIVLANRVGGGTTTSNPLFYQQMQLGGATNLRGFNNNRFTGKSMFFHNIELRLKLFDFTSYLFPGTVGLIGFNDVGRVWVPNEKSTLWHHSYGGGIYIVPAELIVIQATVAKSVERTLPYIAIGFRF